MQMNNMNMNYNANVSSNASSLMMQMNMMQQMPTSPACVVPPPALFKPNTNLINQHQQYPQCSLNTSMSAETDCSFATTNASSASNSQTMTHNMLFNTPCKPAFASRAMRFFTAEGGTTSVMSDDLVTSVTPPKSLSLTPAPTPALSQFGCGSQNSTCCSIADISDVAGCQLKEKKARRSRDKCRYCRKYKSATETFEEHMLTCSHRPDMKNRVCKHCEERIPDDQSFADHNITCAKNKLRKTCVVCHQNELKETVNAEGQCARCVDIMARLNHIRCTPEKCAKSIPTRQFGIVKAQKQQS